MPLMRILGVDPGARGGLAIVEDNRVLRVHDMPVTMIKRKGRSAVPRVDPVALSRLVRELTRTHPLDGAAIEAVHAMPKDSRANAFTFGKATGVVLGVLAGVLGIVPEPVEPQRWKHKLAVPADKQAARARATQLFGARAGNELWPLAKHDGRAEAALIALWGVGYLSARQGGGVEW